MKTTTLTNPDPTQAIVDAVLAMPLESIVVAALPSKPGEFASTDGILRTGSVGWKGFRRGLDFAGRGGDYAHADAVEAWVRQALTRGYTLTLIEPHAPADPARTAR